MSLLKPHHLALVNRLALEAVDRGMRAEIRPITYAAGRWPLLRIEDAARAGRPILLVTAGIHGEEIAGPMTFHHRFAEIAEAAAACGLQLVCYPLVNPSGFARGNRYGDDCAPDGNNDFLRYRLADGRWVWDLPPDAAVMEWRWSSDARFGLRLPPETAAMHERLRQEDWPRVAAAIDLHQDFLSSDQAPGAYHYAYGDLARYAPIVEEVGRIVPIAADRPFHVTPDAPGGAMRTDARGFIVRHDGSLSDLWHRLGVPHALTVETLGATPIEDAIRVNLAWIRGVSALAA